MCTTESAFLVKRSESESYLVKREALEAGAKHEASDSGTKYASRTTLYGKRSGLRQ